MKTLTITRMRGYYGAARAMALYVDGEKVGKIKHRESLTLEVADDAQELYGKIDWTKTERFALSGATDGAALVIRTWFTLNPLRNLGITTMPARIELDDSQVEEFR